MTVDAPAARPQLVDRLPRGARAIAIAGILLGGLAFWLALPPVAARTPVWSIAIGIVAAFCGLWGVTRGQKRVGWGAVAAALIGIAGGVLATRPSIGNLDIVVTWSALGAATLRYATR